MIENFDVSDSFILDSYASRYRLTLAKFVSLEDCKPLPPIRIDGDLKVFVTKNNGKHSLELIRYARCCSHYDDFRYHHKCLVDRLLSQGYIALRLEKSFKKFYGRYQDLIEKYQRSVNVMVNDSFPG